MSIETASFEHPFGAAALPKVFSEGTTVLEIIQGHGFTEDQLVGFTVAISLGGKASVVERHQWHYVRPRDGAFVMIAPTVQAPAIGAILTAIISAAAPAIAGWIGLTGTAALIGTALISTIGGLLVNALIPPPEQQKSSANTDATNYTITGSSNVERPYGVFPIPIGRHKMFPPKTARGYTQMDDQEVIYRGRYTYGYGPVTLETLKIGTTDITAFEDVEIEMRNVDQAGTLAHLPDLADKVTAWRTGNEAMTLYPDNITEDGYSVLMTGESMIFRETRDNSTSASVDIRFPRGLVRYSEGAKRSTSVTVNYFYRAYGDTEWTQVDASSNSHDPAPLNNVWWEGIGTVKTPFTVPNDPSGSRTFTNSVTSGLQYTQEIHFPSPGRYEVAAQRVEDIDEERNVGRAAADQLVTDSYFVTLRSVKEGSLPTDPDISEIVIKVRASDQINGQIETLNSIVHQMVPVWDGSAWSAPQVNRHPAWVIAQFLRGPMNQTPLDDNKIGLADLKAWADEEPHWACDGVFDQPITLREAIDTIAATGRARRALKDLKHTIVRDGANGPVVGHLTPQNSYDFKGQIAFPKETHGFRVNVTSERVDWATDEIIVYADGYDESTATEFETLDLPFVVISTAEVDQSNAWRLARYHLAQAILRPETFSLSCDLEHVPWSMGDKIRVAHDVPLIGLGSARVLEAAYSPGSNTTTILVNNSLSDGLIASANIYARLSDGSEVIATGTVDGTSIVVSGDKSMIQQFDMVQAVENGSELFVGLITKISHSDNLQATVEMVPASPDVLLADQGAIPAYSPAISGQRGATTPSVPDVVSIFSGPDAVLVEDNMPDRSRIGVNIRPDFTVGAPPAHYQLRWRVVGATSWVIGPRVNVNTLVYTDALNNFLTYEVDVRAISSAGEISGWASAGSAYTETDSATTGDVSGFNVQVLGQQAILSWESAGANADHYHIRYNSSLSGTWDTSVDVNNNVTGTTLSTVAKNGIYLIKAISSSGSESENAAVVSVASADIGNIDVIEIENFHPEWGGTRGEGITKTGDNLTYSTSGDLFEVVDLDAVEDIFTHGMTSASSYYEHDEVMDLGSVFNVRLDSTIDVESIASPPNMFDTVDVFEVPNMFGAQSSDWRVFLQESHTSDDPNDPGAVWSDWANLSISDLNARGFKFRLFVEITGTNISLTLKRVSVGVNVPERIVSGRDVDCPAGGTTVTFTPPFRSIPSVVIDGEGLPSGFMQEKTVTAGDFTVVFKDASGTPIAASFDWHGVGFGKDLG